MKEIQLPFKLSKEVQIILWVLLGLVVVIYLLGKKGVQQFQQGVSSGVATGVEAPFAVAANSGSQVGGDFYDWLTGNDTSAERADANLNGDAGAAVGFSVADYAIPGQ